MIPKSPRTRRPVTTGLFTSLAVLLGMAPASLAVPQGSGTQQASVAIAVTTMTAGPFRIVNTLKEDLENFLGAALVPGTLKPTLGALRSGEWVLFDAQGTLGPRDLQARLDQGGLMLVGEAIGVDSMRNGNSILFADPSAPGAMTQAFGAKRDRFALEGAVWTLRDREGREISLYGPKNTASAQAVLKAASRWVWSTAAVAESSAGGRIMALGSAEGGFAVQDAARRMVADGALWVDGGNLIEDSNDARGRFTLPQTLSNLGSARLDALVPYKNELRLSHADQIRLAATVPLVAANLKAPPEVRLAPYVFKDVRGTRVAIIGLADGETLSRNNLIGRKTGWSQIPEDEALEWAMNRANENGADAIVIVTNKPKQSLSSLKAKGHNVAAILTHDFETAPPNRVAAVSSEHALGKPWLNGTLSPYEVGKLELQIAKVRSADMTRLDKVSFEVLRPSERDLADETTSKRALEAMSAFDASLSTNMLPDSRTLSKPRSAYQSAEWTMLAASAIRRAAVADVAVVATRFGGRAVNGDVPRSVVEDWLPSGTLIAQATIRGADLRALLNSLGPNVGVAGYDPKRNRIGGRDLNDDEMYRIATTENFAFNETYASRFRGPSTTFRLDGENLAQGGEGVTVAELVIAHLERLKQREGAFTPGFRRDLEALLGDDGARLEPKWTVSLNPVDLSFNGSTPYNNDAFSAVPNSRITAPDTQTLKTKGVLTVAYDGPDLTWENNGTLKYDAATITQSNAQQYRQLTNELRFGSKLFANAVALPVTPLNARLVPYSELAYVTEVMPGVNSKTGAQNPRRQDTLGTLGMALKGSGWLKELRAGVEARKNFALTNRAIEPGVQLALSMGQKAGIFDFTFDSLVDSFLPAAGDSAADLGLSGQFALAAKVPIGGGFGLRLGVDGLVFRGKVAETDALGAVVAPSIGLSYGTTWKPLTGVLY
ncbi:hypothetical protein D3C72_239660 [compost metagenome]